MSLNDASVIEPREAEREKSFEEREEECDAMQIASSAAGLVGDIAGDIGSIPVIGDIASTITSGIAIVSHITQGGLDIAQTALDCDKVPFDALKEIIAEKFNKAQRILLENKAALKKVSTLATRTLKMVEQTRKEMHESFTRVLETIRSLVIKSKISKINNFVKYFNSESERMDGLAEEEYVTKLQEPNSILIFLKDSRTPKIDSLQTSLFEIIDDELAIPENPNDKQAFQALYALFYGTQTYISILFFLIKQHSYLANYYYRERNLEEFNKQFNTIQNVYRDFRYSLIGDKNGVVDNVIQVLEDVKNKEFVTTINDNLYMEISNRTEALLELKSQILEMELPLIEDTPQSIAKITYENLIQTPIGEWEDGSKVKYAVQYEKNGVYSKISTWSASIKINGKAFPTIKIPINKQRRNRLVFRQFNENKPELAGIMSYNQTILRDINRDLYNAAMNMDKITGFKEAQVIINNGADINAVFEDKKSVIHAAALRGNKKILGLLQSFVVDLDKEDKSGLTPLHIASQSGHGDFVEMLIQLGANINSKTFLDKLTPLHIAAEKGFLKIVTNLLRSQTIDVNAKDKDEYTPLHAAINGNISVIKLLLAQPKIDINANSTVGLTPLHLAVISDDGLEAFQALIRNENININAKDVNNLTALHYASMTGNLKMVKHLSSLDYINLNIGSIESNWTPLHFAIYFRYENVALELMNAKNIDLNSILDGNISLLHFSIASGLIKIVEKLLKLDFNLEEKTKQGYTPLHLAAMRSEHEMCTLLVSKGSNIEAKTKKEKTPLHFASYAGRKDTVLFLLSKGANMNAVDIEGQTPIFKAVSNNNLKVVKIFAVKDSNALQAIDKNGDTLISIAAHKLYKDMFKYLVKLGADVNTKNKDGMTPLQTFAKEGNLDVVEFLLENGADVSVRDDQNKNFFYLAVQNGHLDIVKHIFENSIIDLFALDGNRSPSQSFVHWGVCDSIYHEKINVLKYFVSLLPDTPCNPLHTASKFGKLEIVKYLIEEKGMDINIKSDETHETALCFAILNGHLDLVKYFIGRNAVIYEACDNIDKPVISAMNEKYFSILKFLMKNGANPKRVDHNKNTPLHYAVLSKCEKCVVYLVEEEKVDVNAAGFRGNTALHATAALGDEDMTLYLISNGAKVELKNSNGKTPIDYAFKYGHPTLADFMITFDAIRNKPEDISTQKRNLLSDSKIIKFLNANENKLIPAHKSEFLPSKFLKMAHRSRMFEKTRVLIPSFQNADPNGLLLLLNVFVRKVSNNKFISANDEILSSLVA